MKKMIIACDSFKESMSAIEACEAIEKGIKRVNKNYETLLIPMADGGEGTSDILSYALDGEFVNVMVHGPLLSMVNAKYFYDEHKHIAFMEVAQACGLDLINVNDRNPLNTSTLGVGDMILDALNKGAKTIYVGLGGSSTNDGGLGMLRALGAKFIDNHNQIITEVSDLLNLVSIDLDNALDTVKDCRIIVMSDVDNPFIGTNGATHVFAKQKGATPLQINRLEQCLNQYNYIVNKQYHIDLSKINKTGAAGGLGGAFYLIKGQLRSGIDTILDITQFQSKIKEADLIITGEGSIDNQTAHGKTISGILKSVKNENIPVIAFAGRVTDDIDELYDLGLTAAFSITNEAKPLDKALKDGKKSLETTSYNFFRILNL